MMDDVAFKLGMDPVDFVLKNMTRKANDEAPYTNYTLEDCIHRGVRSIRMEETLAREARVGCRASQAWRGIRLPRIPCGRRSAAAP